MGVDNESTAMHGDGRCGRAIRVADDDEPCTRRGRCSGLWSLAVPVVVLVAQRLRVEPSPDGGYATGRERRIGLGDVKAAAVRWTTTTNHREIGLLYIAFGTVAAIWGGIDAMMIRTHLLTPEANLWTEQTYNELFTMHGLTMLIFFVTPVFSGSGTTFCRC